MSGFLLLFKHLRDEGRLLPYFGFLWKRHRAIVAYVLLTSALVFVVHRDGKSDTERLAKVAEARCEAVNEFRNNTNRQFQHFVEHNEAAVVLFANVGTALIESPTTTARFRKIGKEFLAASEYYHRLSQEFQNVPLEVCSDVKVESSE